MSCAVAVAGWFEKSSGALLEVRSLFGGVCVGRCLAAAAVDLVGYGRRRRGAVAIAGLLRPNCGGVRAAVVGARFVGLVEGAGCRMGFGVVEGA